LREIIQKKLKLNDTIIFCSQKHNSINKNIVICGCRVSNPKYFKSEIVTTPTWREENNPPKKIIITAI